jgi:hypothetical protein
MMHPPPFCAQEKNRVREEIEQQNVIESVSQQHSQMEIVQSDESQNKENDGDTYHSHSHFRPHPLLEEVSKQITKTKTKDIEKRMSLFLKTNENLTKRIQKQGAVTVKELLDMMKEQNIEVDKQTLIAYLKRKGVTWVHKPKIQ